MSATEGGGSTVGEGASGAASDGLVPVIDLSKAPGERQAWDRAPLVVYLWAVFELLFVTNPFQISSRLRVLVLRMFGAEIGSRVIFRPRTEHPVRELQGPFQID